MSLRVLVLVNRVPWPVKDGGTLAHYNLLHGLQQAQCQVTIAALNTSKHWVDVKSLPQSFNNLGTLHTTFVDNKVKPLAAFLNLFTKKSYHLQRFITPHFEQQLLDILKHHTFDLVIFDGLYTAPYVHLVRAHSQAKLWLRQHNVEYQIWETLAHQTKTPLKKWYINLLATRLKSFEQQVLNAFDAVVALTQNDLQQLQHMGCTKPMLVSPVGISFRQTVSQTKPQPYTVFHLGAMDWQPNQQAMQWFVTQVWPQVIAQVPQAIFYMAGKKMPDWFKQYQTKNIKIIGEVEDAVEFMQSKQIMIVPLFAGSGIRVKILEGMSVGKAIVSTALGAQGIDAVADKHLLLAENAHDFAQQIIKLLQQQALCNALSQQATELALQNYDNNKVTAKLLNFYYTQQGA